MPIPPFRLTIGPGSLERRPQGAKKSSRQPRHPRGAKDSALTPGAIGRCTTGASCTWLSIRAQQLPCRTKQDASFHAGSPFLIRRDAQGVRSRCRIVHSAALDHDGRDTRQVEERIVNSAASRKSLAACSVSHRARKIGDSPAWVKIVFLSCAPCFLRVADIVLPRHLRTVIASRLSRRLECGLVPGIHIVWTTRSTQWDVAGS
jgi:hypothetical protein